MAMFFHGYERFTEQIDILVTPEGLEELHGKLNGMGYVEGSPNSESWRDAEYGVRINFLVAGDYPGDRKPKPVMNPNPREAGRQFAGIRCLALPRLLELLIASGMTSPRRLSDLGDAQQLIEKLHLTEDLIPQLHPFVRDKYRELWVAIRDNPWDPCA
jgi:hypothetical protein